MADEIRQQPVAIRVTRPYPSADEFLEHELETLTRTSITLLGAQPRPKGVILRFEVALTGGAQLLRGEGRVVGFKENALGDQPGLVLRFTRLDTKSKALVDRAAAIREARARAALQAAMGEDSLAPPASIPPGSLPPHSIGPMSVVQEPPRAATPSMASSPPTRPAPITAPPAFFTQEKKQSVEPPPPPAPSSGSFDDATFSSAEDAPTAAETAMNPNLFGTGGSFAPPVPAEVPPSVPAPAAVAAAPPPAPSSSSAAVRSAPPGAASSGSSLQGARALTEREPFLERLRDRAKNLSPERIGALLRR